MNRPSPLKVVAALFIASGVWAAISIAGALIFERRIVLDVDVLGLWIGPGLLRHDARYRVWALRLLVLDFIVTPIAALILILQPAPLVVRALEKPVGTTSLPVALAILATLLAIEIWEFVVLHGPNVRELFDSTAAPQATTPSA